MGGKVHEAYLVIPASIAGKAGRVKVSSSLVSLNLIES